MERYEGDYLDEEELERLHQQQQQQQQHPHAVSHQQIQHVPPRQGTTPTQTVVDEAELLAAQAAAEAAAAQQQQQPGGAFNNVGQGLTGKYRDMMMQYWQETINSIEHDDHDFKNHQLPLARIKKVMKTDEDVRMISAEAPILFAKGCDVFITELTMRAWIHAEENKRRTLQKSDIAAALTKSDMFDFLIDVVPREEEKPKKTYTSSRTNTFINATQVPKSGSPPKTEQSIHHGVPARMNNAPPQQLLQHQMLQQQMLQQQMMNQQPPQPQAHQPPHSSQTSQSPRMQHPHQHPHQQPSQLSSIIHHPHPAQVQNSHSESTTPLANHNQTQHLQHHPGPHASNTSIQSAPEPHPLAANPLPRANGNINNNSTDSNFTNFQEFGSTNYEGDF